MRPALLTPLLLLPLGLAGCERDAGEMWGSQFFGNAVKHNIAAQVANPEPRPLTAEEQAFNGQRAALQHERYVRDQSEEPEDIRTTTTVGGGS
jgi:hypothetical protein